MPHSSPLSDRPAITPDPSRVAPASQSGPQVCSRAMERIIQTWHSPALDRTMGVARWGWWGRPVVFFPTGGGDFLDCERFLMVRALQPLIEAGRIKLYSV